MKIFYRSILAIAALTFAGSAFAHFIDINSPPDGEDSIFQIANDVTYTSGDQTNPLFGDLNESSPQANHAYWSFGQNDTSSSVLRATFTANFAGAEFGVYSLGDTSNRLTLLNGGTQNGSNGNSNTTALLNYTGDGHYTTFTMTDGLPNDGTEASATFSGNVFGFFLSIGGNTYFSDPSKNDGDYRMVGYQGEGNGASLASDEYLFGWEDGTDNDYQDYVVTVSSIHPVPEPSSIAVLGMGLLLIGFAVRRIQKRES